MFYKSIPSSILSLNPGLGKQASSQYSFLKHAGQCILTNTKITQNDINERNKFRKNNVVLDSKMGI